MGRKLRVDFSNEGTSDDNNDGGNSNRNNNQPADPYANLNGAATAQSTSLPPLPPGVQLPPGVTATDAISRTLNTLPPTQLLDILQQMKTLATNDPARATELLSQAPQLSYAVFQALLLMGLVSPEAINSVLQPGSMAAPPAAPPVGYPPQAGFPPQMVATNTPPVSNPYAPPPPAAAAPPGQDPESLMAAVMQLPQEVIDQLPEAEKQQILALRASFQAQQR